MERQLATIRTINKLVSIDGADFIELAIIDGWQCIVKKGEFQVNDKCVYFEIDSLLPINEHFEFLSKGNKPKTNQDGTIGYRLKTIRLRKELSQGLALPTAEFEELKNIEIGDDVTEILNIVKYEPPLPSDSTFRAKGNYPIFLNKSDESRIQNLSRNIQIFKNKNIKFRVSEKLDGSSATFYLHNGEFGVCSRNWDLDFDENNMYWQCAIQYNIEENMRDFSIKNDLESFAIHGELIGEGIQNNIYQLKGRELRMYYLYDINNMEYSDRLFDEFVFRYDMKICPILNAGITLNDFIDTNSILEFAEGKSQLNEVEREGVVFQSPNREYHFKAISNKFLLKEKD